MTASLLAARPASLARFDAALAVERLARSSRDAYVKDVNRFLRWHRRRSRDGEVLTGDLLTYRDELLFERGQAVATVKRALASLRRYFAWLRMEGHLASSPLDAVPSPRLATAPGPPALEGADLDRLLEAAATTGCDRDRARNFLMVALLANTGLRLSELLDLRWDDVMLESERLEVRSGKGLVGRSVPIATFLGDILKRFAGPEAPTGRCFLVTGTARRMSSRAVQHVFECSRPRRVALAGSRCVAVRVAEGAEFVEARSLRGGSVYPEPLRFLPWEWMAGREHSLGPGSVATVARSRGHSLPAES